MDDSDAVNMLPTRAKWLVGLLLGAVLVEAAVGLLSLGSMAQGYMDTDHFSPAPGFELPVFLAGAVVWLIWQYGAHARLARVSRRELRFTPAWAVGWWFIPFANLVQPFRAITELLEASARDDAAPGAPRLNAWVLPAWWGCYLGGNVCARIATMIVATGDADDALLWMTLGAAALCAAGVLAIMIIRAVEDRLAELAAFAPTIDGVWIGGLFGGAVLAALAGGAVWVFGLNGFQLFEIVSLYDLGGAAVCVVAAALVGASAAALVRTFTGRRGAVVAVAAVTGSVAAVLIGQAVLGDMSTRFGRVIDDWHIPLVSSDALFITVAGAAAFWCGITGLRLLLPSELPAHTAGPTRTEQAPQPDSAPEALDSEEK